MNVNTREAINMRLIDADKEERRKMKEEKENAGSNVGRNI